MEEDLIADMAIEVHRIVADITIEVHQIEADMAIDRLRTKIAAMTITDQEAETIETIETIETLNKVADFRIRWFLSPACHNSKEFAMEL